MCSIPRPLGSKQKKPVTDASLLTQITAALKDTAPPSSDFDLNPGSTLPAGRKLRAAAVLVPLVSRESGLSLVLTKRAAALRHHPGQVAFPGGKQEPGDMDLDATALREANEEIGLDRAKVEILGTLPAHETVTGFSVTPKVGWVTPSQPWCVDPGEVDEVFEVPLAHVLRPRNYRVEGRMWQGQRRQYFVVPYGPYYIWGATARILRGLADRVPL